MEKSNQPSFLKSLALAFGDGLAFSVAVRLAQGPSKKRENVMTDLGPLAERLRNVEDRKEQVQTIDKEALTKFGEGLDGRVLEKVIVALEARLTEHAGQVDRRLAEIDAQVALDLKAVDTHTAAQTSAVEKAIQQIEAQVREYVTAAQQAGVEQIAGVDQRLSALQEALPTKFREIIEAVRQSMEARLALELKEVEGRVAAGKVAPEHLQELETRLRGEVEALAGRLSADMHGLVEHQQSQAAPLQHALQQLETKLTTLREELPPKIRQIVEAVESSMEARIAAGEENATGRMTAIEQALELLKADLPGAGGYQQAIEESLRRHAEQVGALDQKLTVLQEELPPKIKAIVDAVRDSLDARMAIELKDIEEKHAAHAEATEARFGEARQQIREQLAAELKTPALEQDLAKLHADLSDVQARLETGDRRVADHLAGLEEHAAHAAAGVYAELESLQDRHRAEIAELEARWAAERAAENIPARIEAAVGELRQSLETKLAGEIHELAASRPDRSAELEKALEYASLLEARVQALEHKLVHSTDEIAERAIERVWQALESRLQERGAQAPAAAQPAETITGLRQKSTSAEQSVLDLIAGIGQLFEKPAPRVVRETPPPPPPAQSAPATPAAIGPAEPVAAAPVEAAPEPVVVAPDEPEPVSAPAVTEPVAEAPAAEPVATVSTPEVTEPAPAAPVIAMPEQAPRQSAIAVDPAEEAANEHEEETEPMPAAISNGSTEGEPKLDDKPPVILFRPKETGRKWRIPFVSSFLLMAIAAAWLELL